MLKHRAAIFRGLSSRICCWIWGVTLLSAFISSTPLVYGLSRNSTCQAPGGNDGVTCFDGFRLSSLMDRCEDVDECAAPAARATPLSTCSSQTGPCRNTLGSYYCDCLSGFERCTNSSCVNIDECKRYPGLCQPGGQCQDLPGAYQCACIAGYARDPLLSMTSCHDIDECSTTSSSDACSASSELCVNTLGSYLCLNESYLSNLGANCSMPLPPNNCEFALLLTPTTYALASLLGGLLVLVIYLAWDKHSLNMVRGKLDLFGVSVKYRQKRAADDHVNIQLANGQVVNVPYDQLATFSLKSRNSGKRRGSLRSKSSAERRKSRFIDKTANQSPTNRSPTFSSADDGGSHDDGKVDVENLDDDDSKGRPIVGTVLDEIRCWSQLSTIVDSMHCDWQSEKAEDASVEAGETPMSCQKSVALAVPSTTATECHEFYEDVVLRRQVKICEDCFNDYTVLRQIENGATRCQHSLDTRASLYALVKPPAYASSQGSLNGGDGSLSDPHRFESCSGFHLTGSRSLDNVPAAVKAAPLPTRKVPTVVVDPALSQSSMRRRSQTELARNSTGITNMSLDLGESSRCGSSMIDPWMRFAGPDVSDWLSSPEDASSKVLSRSTQGGFLSTLEEPAKPSSPGVHRSPSKRKLLMRLFSVRGAKSMNDLENPHGDAALLAPAKQISPVVSTEAASAEGRESSPPFTTNFISDSPLTSDSRELLDTTGAFFVATAGLPPSRKLSEFLSLSKESEDKSLADNVSASIANSSGYATGMSQTNSLSSWANTLETARPPAAHSLPFLASDTSASASLEGSFQAQDSMDTDGGKYVPIEPLRKNGGNAYRPSPLSGAAKSGSDIPRSASLSSTHGRARSQIAILRNLTEQRNQGTMDSFIMDENASDEYCQVDFNHSPKKRGSADEVGLPVQAPSKHRGFNTAWRSLDNLLDSDCDADQIKGTHAALRSPLTGQAPGQAHSEQMASCHITASVSVASVHRSRFALAPVESPNTQVRRNTRMLLPSEKTGDARLSIGGTRPTAPSFVEDLQGLDADIQCSRTGTSSTLCSSDRSDTAATDIGSVTSSSRNRPFPSKCDGSGLGLPLSLAHHTRTVSASSDTNSIKSISAAGAAISLKPGGRSSDMGVPPTGSVDAEERHAQRLATANAFRVSNCRQHSETAVTKLSNNSHYPPRSEKALLTSEDSNGEYTDMVFSGPGTFPRFSSEPTSTCLTSGCTNGEAPPAHTGSSRALDSEQLLSHTQSRTNSFDLSNGRKCSETAVSKLSISSQYSPGSVVASHIAEEANDEYTDMTLSGPGSFPRLSPAPILTSLTSNYTDNEAPPARSGSSRSPGGDHLLSHAQPHTNSINLAKSRESSATAMPAQSDSSQHPQGTEKAIPVSEQSNDEYTDMTSSGPGSFPRFSTASTSLASHITDCDAPPARTGSCRAPGGEQLLSTHTQQRPNSINHSKYHQRPTTTAISPLSDNLKRPQGSGKVMLPSEDANDEYTDMTISAPGLFPRFSSASVSLASNDTDGDGLLARTNDVKDSNHRSVMTQETVVNRSSAYEVFAPSRREARRLMGAAGRGNTTQSQGDTTQSRGSESGRLSNDRVAIEPATSQPQTQPASFALDSNEDEAGEYCDMTVKPARASSAPIQIADGSQQKKRPAALPHQRHSAFGTGTVRDFAHTRLPSLSLSVVGSAGSVVETPLGESPADSEQRMQVSGSFSSVRSEEYTLIHAARDTSLRCANLKQQLTMPCQNLDVDCAPPTPNVLTPRSEQSAGDMSSMSAVDLATTTTPGADQGPVPRMQASLAQPYEQSRHTGASTSAATNHKPSSLKAGAAVTLDNREASVVHSNDTTAKAESVASPSLICDGPSETAASRRSSMPPEPTAASTKPAAGNRSALSGSSPAPVRGGARAEHDNLNSPSASRSRDGVQQEAEDESRKAVDRTSVAAAGIDRKQLPTPVTSEPLPHRAPAMLPTDSRAHSALPQTKTATRSEGVTNSAAPATQATSRVGHTGPSTATAQHVDVTVAANTTVTTPNSKASTVLRTGGARNSTATTAVTPATPDTKDEDAYTYTQFEDVTARDNNPYMSVSLLRRVSPLSSPSSED